MSTYKAPWSSSLIVMSSLATIVCVVVSAVMTISRVPPSPLAWLLPVAVVLVSALFTVRDYSISADTLHIQRLLWDTRLPLRELHAAEFRPDAMTGSLRTFGNGGLFSFTGFFYNKRLGAYRAYVTDLHRTVVLRFAKRTIVVSPDRPLDFARDIATKSGANLITDGG